MQKTIVAIAAGLMATTTLIGSANAETLRWARSFDSLTLDPHSQNSGVTHNFNSHIYDSLIGRDIDGEFLPLLATDWYLKEGDDTVWVFELREGVTFHNGNEFTADDVVFSIDRARSEISNMRQLHADVESVTAIDDYTVEVQMSGPSPLYPNNLTNTFIMDREWSEENDVVEVQDFAAGEENYAVRNANGTGAYELVSRDPDVRSVLTYNENYWGEEPQVTEIEYVVISDNATRMAALLSGEVDFVQDVPFQDVERLASTDGIVVESGPENRVSFFGYWVGEEPLSSSNITDANPLADPLVREAIHLAVDRDAIRQVVMRGYSVPTCTLAPLRVSGWTEENDTCPEVDIDRANELMAEAGYADGFSIALDAANNTAGNDEAIAQAVVGMLGQIGIEVNLTSRPQAQHSPLITSGESEFYIMSWGVPTFDSAYIFNDLVHTKGGNYGTYNPTGYSNPELDAMIESLGTETDTAVRDQTVADIWDVVQEDRFLLPLHNNPLAYAMREGINMPIHPENKPQMRDLTFD
ncbi:ABC transporter substrate-binding protein [Pelagibacterium luteolum]|uniref:Peptide/nickel transport system substrate-binding protein n=1 Tax=Pelagibacterium luteolum TaxID=440168 RepID=A0A1G7ZJF9_9HYPH|nr:ABC transporter substrate-binding protein [Pelagibacterium luteolum]SDH08838.1 peptide/nickel transport system substrate-binding protein [Pelagibacterium luteolum]